MSSFYDRIYFMSDYQNNSIFWVETEKIGANPFQPRREFNPKSLEDLADSIRQYGVLQPLVVTRKEEQNEDGGISVYYELIAGERRLRASRLAGLEQVPVIIRKAVDGKVKLELSIIENLQREDLNPIDRALAFDQLYKEFKLTHADIGKKMGKSRVYVSNSLRLLSLPDNIKQGLMSGTITEGHTRPLLMLSDRPKEQETLYKEITLKKMSVRESEKVARSIAQDRVRKKKFVRDPRIRDFEKRLSDNLGTRVQIEQKENGGKITIDYFTVNDLESILNAIKKVDHGSAGSMMENFVNQQEERKLKQSISSLGPIDFIPSEVSNITNNNDDHDNNSYHHDKEQLPDIKKLDSFIHDTNDEVVKYEERLPEFDHNENNEIVVQGEPNQYIINNSVNNSYVAEPLDQGISNLDREDMRRIERDNEHIMWRSAPDDDLYRYHEDGQLDNDLYRNNQINGNDKQQPSSKKRGFINRIFN